MVAERSRVSMRPTSTVRLQEAEPPPIGKLDGLARAFCKVIARSSGLVEDVSWLVGPSSFAILRFVLAILGRYMRGAYKVSGG
jgi:hypothetical protein